jgi:hypothetical protein
MLCADYRAIMADQSERSCVPPALQGVTRKPYKSSQ